jgi:hypothetical protein
MAPIVDQIRIHSRLDLVWFNPFFSGTVNNIRVPIIQQDPPGLIPATPLFPPEPPGEVRKCQLDPWSISLHIVLIALTCICSKVPIPSLYSVLRTQYRNPYGTHTHTPGSHDPSFHPVFWTFPPDQQERSLPLNPPGPLVASPIGMHAPVPR